MIDTRLYEKLPQDPLAFQVKQYEHTGYAFSEHWHEHTEIHLILEGSCTLDCNGGQSTLRAGDCAVINGGELHRGGRGSCVFLCLLLSPTFLGNTHIIFERVIRDAYVSSLFPKIAELARSTELPSLLEGRGAVHLLMAHLIRNYALREMGGAFYTRHITKLEKLNQAITFINQNYAKPISTAQLAEMLYLSEGYFCQLFKEVMKQSAMEYLNVIRTEKAKHLLKTTDMSIAEIAFCCGFSDANYFSRMYKKVNRESPTQSRIGNHVDEN